MRPRCTGPTRRLLYGFCVVAIACLVSANASAQEKVQVELGGKPFDLEYVADPESRRVGLMGRKDLPAGTGMLFDFPAGTQPAIWMRNMVISLDLLYVDADGQIVQIFAAVPPCRTPPCEIFRAQKPLRFVLEVPAGTAQDLGLAEGDRLSLGPLLEQPAPLQ